MTAMRKICVTVLPLVLAACTAGPILPADGDDTSDTSSGEMTGDGDGDLETGDGDGDPESTGDGDGDPATGTDSGSNGYGIWAETKCVEVSEGNPVLFGRPVGSETAWSIVVSSDVIGMWPVGKAEDWVSDTSCAWGTLPDAAFGDVDCRTTDTGGFCYVGDDEYRSPIAPACEFGGDVADWWPSDRCGGATVELVGKHPWDDVVCQGVSGGACFGLTGSAAMLVYPSCWVEVKTESEDCEAWNPDQHLGIKVA